MRRSLLVLLIVAGAILGAASAAQASPFMYSVMQDDNQLIYSSHASRDLALRRMKIVGVDAVRVTVLWDAVATKKKPRRGEDPKAYPARNWDRYDDLVRTAGQYGIQVYFNVTPPGPRWSQSKANDPANQRTWKPNDRQFNRFFQAVGRRYSGQYRDENQGKTIIPRVSWWGIGNEPNQGGWLMPQAQRKGGRLVPTSPALYRRLLVAGADALIRSGHGGDLILFGETAPLGVPPQSERRPLRPALFIRELFCLQKNMRRYRGSASRARDCGYLKRLSILSKLPRLSYAHHPYTKKTSPQRRDKSRDAITMANLGDLPKLLDGVADRTKLIPRGVPVLLTEFGYETNPPDRFNGISLATQAEWNNLGDFAAYREPRVFANTQFLLFDVPPRREFPRNTKAYWFTYQSGIYRSDGTAKPSAFAYLMPFIARRASGGNYLFWGMLRFAPNGAEQQVFLQRRVGGSWQTVQGPIQVGNPVGFWEVTRPAAKGETWRYYWLAPDGSDVKVSREITLK